MDGEAFISHWRLAVGHRVQASKPPHPNAVVVKIRHRGRGRVLPDGARTAVAVRSEEEMMPFGELPEIDPETLASLSPEVRLAIELTDLDRQLDDIEQSEDRSTPSALLGHTGDQ